MNLLGLARKCAHTLTNRRPLSPFDLKVGVSALGAVELKPKAKWNKEKKTLKVVIKAT